MKIYYVYLLTNIRNNVFYVGVTNDLEQRVFDHKAKNFHGFTSRYNCDKLVYYEELNDIRDAIRREKQLKRYHRAWKIELVERENREWRDLTEGWYVKSQFDLNKKIKEEELKARKGI